MRLLSVEIHETAGSGGLLQGLNLGLHSDTCGDEFAPLCFIGANGSGKSQFLQILAEMFQAAWHACAPEEERAEADTSLCFTVRYLIRRTPSERPLLVVVSREREGRKVGPLRIRIESAEGDFEELTSPHRVVRTKCQCSIVAGGGGDPVEPG